MADGALLSFLCQDPVFGAEWEDIEYKAAIECLGKNKLLTPAQLANIRIEELGGSESLPAGLKGVLRRALERATTAGKQVVVRARLTHLGTRALVSGRRPMWKWPPPCTTSTWAQSWRRFR